MSSFRLTAWVLALSALPLLGAQAQTTALAHDPAALQALAQRWASAAVAKEQQAVGQGLRMEVHVGAPDSRLRLAACSTVEAYVPPGARLWGSSRVGVRCTDGSSRWNITLPVTVKALGEAWVVKNPLAAGATVGEADITRGEVDWAQEASPVLTERSAWLGQTANRVLSTGQALRQNMVRAAQVFQAGAVVKIVAQGPGFQIASEAQALSAGVVGQPARVRMDNGRVATGTVLDSRTVQIAL